MSAVSKESKNIILEFIRIKEDRVCIYYSLSKEYNPFDKLKILETEPTELSKKIHDSIVKKVSKFGYRKDSLRLLTSENQTDGGICFVWYDDHSNELKQYEPMFTTEQSRNVKQFLNDCFDVVKQSL